MSYAKNTTSITHDQKSLLREIMTLASDAKLNNPKKINQSTKNIKQVQNISESLPQKTMPEENKILAKPIPKVLIAKNSQAQITEEEIATNNAHPLQINLFQHNASFTPRNISTSPKMYNYNPKNNPLSPTHVARLMKPPDDELAFLNEKNEWVAINKFQMYKDSQEKNKKKTEVYKEMEQLNSF